MKFKNKADGFTFAETVIVLIIILILVNKFLKKKN